LDSGNKIVKDASVAPLRKAESLISINFINPFRFLEENGTTAKVLGTF